MLKGHLYEIEKINQEIFISRVKSKKLNSVENWNEKINCKNFVLPRKDKSEILKVFLKVTKKVYDLKIKVNYGDFNMAKQVKLDEFNINVFDGSNYSSWKTRIKLILEYKECIQPTERTRNSQSSTETEDVWNKLDLKARNYLVSSVSDKQLEFIKDCKSALEMMTKLDSMYTTQSTALIMIKRNALEEMKLKNYDSIEEFFIAFEKATNELIAAGYELKEKEKLTYLIKALPATYSSIGDFIDFVPEKDKTVEFAKSKIREKSLSVSDKDKKSNASTFNTQTKGNCFQCGKSNHYKKDCWYAPNNQHKGQSRGSAHNNNSNSRGSQRGRGRGNYKNFGRGRGAGQGRGNTPGEQQSNDNNNNSAGTWLTQVQRSGKHGNLEMYACENDNKNEIEWLLDSGSTDHIINTDKFFDSYIILKSPLNVKLPDGKILQATKVGKITLNFETYYNTSTIEINNVYFVKDINKNLLSLSKITNNCTLVAKYDEAKIYNEKRELLAVAKKTNDLYLMKSYVKNKNTEIFINATELTNKEKWHRALGHVNFKYLEKLVNEKLVYGLPENLESKFMKCANCIQSKMANVPFKNKRTETNEH